MGTKKKSTDVIVVKLQKPMFPVKKAPNKYIDLTADLSPTTPISTSRPETRIASPKVRPLLGDAKCQIPVFSAVDSLLLPRRTLTSLEDLNLHHLQQQQ